jgi:hypothetical protein
VRFLEYVMKARMASMKRYEAMGTDGAMAESRSSDRCEDNEDAACDYEDSQTFFSVIENTRKMAKEVPHESIWAVDQS